MTALRPTGPAPLPVTGPVLPTGGPGRAARAALNGPAWELVLLLTALVGVARLVDGPLVWVVALFTLGAALCATLEVLGDLAPEGVPVESLLGPAVTAIAGIGAIRFVPVGLLVVPALGAVAALLAAAAAVERRILASPSGANAADRTALLGLLLLVGFLAFAGIALVVPGALVEPVAGSAPLPVDLGPLALLAGADAAVAALVGYRLAALRVPALREVLWAALTFALVIGIAAAALRAMAIPRLLGPALLTLVLYLWNAYRSTPRPARRDARWLWELLLLAAVGILVVAWNLVARG